MGDGGARDAHAPPHAREELVIGHDAAAVLQEVEDQVEHLGLNLDARASARDRHGLVVDSNVAYQKDHRSLVLYETIDVAPWLSRNRRPPCVT